MLTSNNGKPSSFPGSLPEVAIGRPGEVVSPMREPNPSFRLLGCGIEVIQGHTLFFFP